MSISIGHRAIFTAFGHRASFAPPRAAAPSPARGAEATASPEGGQLTCSPWEGLYLEQARPAAATDDEKNRSRQLDEFLSNLMYGE
jgi:hypothetical protein